MRLNEEKKNDKLTTIGFKAWKNKEYCTCAFFYKCIYKMFQDAIYLHKILSNI